MIDFTPKRFQSAFPFQVFFAFLLHYFDFSPELVKSQPMGWQVPQGEAGILWVGGKLCHFRHVPGKLGHGWDLSLIVYGISYLPLDLPDMPHDKAPFCVSTSPPLLLSQHHSSLWHFCTLSLSLWCLDGHRACKNLSCFAYPCARQRQIYYLFSPNSPACFYDIPYERVCVSV